MGEHKHLRITVNGTPYDVMVEVLGDGGATATPLAPAPVARQITASAAPAAPTPVATPAVRSVATPGALVAPIAGVVMSIDVKVGDTVAMNQRVITVESMKMETPINATQAGTVKAIHVAVGAAITEGEPLVTVE